MRLYLETSVPNFLFAMDAPDKRAATVQLFDEIERGLHEAAVSGLYSEEVERTESALLRSQLRIVPSLYSLEVIPVTEECTQLADNYIAAQAFTQNNYVDALHVAVAVIAKCEVVVSWNFGHIVRAWTIKKVSEVNHQLGLTAIVICSPQEVIENATGA